MSTAARDGSHIRSQHMSTRDKQGEHVSKPLAMESRRKVTSPATELKRMVMSVEWEYQRQAGRANQLITSDGIKEGHVTSNGIERGSCQQWLH
jgi:hypothetical protein